MYLFGIHILHRWVGIYIEENEEFMGNTLPKFTPTSYRFCKECKKVQKYFYVSQGGYYETLSKEKQKIIIEKIFKKNDHYLLNIK